MSRLDGILEPVYVASGTEPALFPGETKIVQQAKTFLCDEEGRPDKMTNDNVLLTTHRLIWTRASINEQFSIRLESILGATPAKGLFRTTGRIDLSLGSNAPQGWQGKRVLIRIHDKDVLTKKLEETLRTRPWASSPLPPFAEVMAAYHAYQEQLREQQQQQQLQQQQQQQYATAETQMQQPQQQPQQQQQYVDPTPTAIDSSHLGIAGLRKREEDRQRATNAALSTAFGDVDSLMAQAKTLVDIADRIKAANEREAREGAARGDKEAAEQAEFDSYLACIGIGSRVTKDTAGDAFITELAKEISGFCIQVMARKGPVIAMPDLFCIFNKSRGHDLVSPADLLAACHQLEPLGLPVRLHKFDSGVLAVYQAGSNEEQELAKLVKQHGPLTAADVGRLRNVPLALAKELCLAAEKAGVLCRDDTYQGTVFYENFFARYNSSRVA